MSETTADPGSDGCGTQGLPELVIFVHGTFSTSDDEVGSRWWQRTSEYWNWMQAHLPPHSALLDKPFRLFTWDGRNSQVSRLHAANKLLAFMLELERQGRNYHLVGHSHGGSLIWEALVSAEVTRSDRRVYAGLRRALNDQKIRLGDKIFHISFSYSYFPNYNK